MAGRRKEAEMDCRVTVHGIKRQYCTWIYGACSEYAHIRLVDIKGGFFVIKLSPAYGLGLGLGSLELTISEFAKAIENTKGEVEGIQMFAPAFKQDKGKTGSNGVVNFYPRPDQLRAFFAMFPQLIPCDDKDSALFERGGEHSARWAAPNRSGQGWGGAGGGQNRGPRALRIFCFVGGLLMLITSLLGMVMINPIGIILNKADHTLHTFEGLFGFVTMIVEAPNIPFLVCQAFLAFLAVLCILFVAWHFGLDKKISRAMPRPSRKAARTRRSRGENPNDDGFVPNPHRFPTSSSSQMMGQANYNYNSSSYIPPARGQPDVNPGPPPLGMGGAMGGIGGIGRLQQGPVKFKPLDRNKDPRANALHSSGGSGAGRGGAGGGQNRGGRGNVGVGIGVGANRPADLRPVLHPSANAQPKAAHPKAKPYNDVGLSNQGSAVRRSKRLAGEKPEYEPPEDPVPALPAVQEDDGEEEQEEE
ncbi:unnamed protein product [Vitrella brassicaformis CCMP3155]|uniref:Uncharacterized protein n=1 Tax=Vitrella brassicaformis (strain CCMP3155) TaxID=1169540 RepID=A0A0G4FIY8_VITBC|nr:unnamed protein product [Vitrella brassicaformis CCMP3155]|eukprot:CEM13677.1 unnamed protein product [Vitrella brassicaformis CCMP3155]